MSTQSPTPQFDRVLLKNQVVEFLRQQIIIGDIPPGTHLIEREVADRLGVSRAPVREAILQLEQEGLLEMRSNGRRVIEMTQQDIVDLYRARLVLEDLATRLVVEKCNGNNLKALREALRKMESAVTHKDHTAFVIADVEMHELMWEQTTNKHLQKALQAIAGPIFMSMVRNMSFDWSEALDLHRDLLACIEAGDADAAAESIKRHAQSAYERSMQRASTEEVRPSAKH
jgi:GntR family transcriptional regulator of gluconate operon